jgi:hypothetical protein
MKKKHYLILTFALVVCAGIFLLCRYREQPLRVLLSGEGTAKYSSWGYYDGMESHIEGAIPQESLSDFLDSATIRKGNTSRSMPSPCFEITVVYDNETYRVVVGADKTISVAPVSNFDSRTFWIDTSGTLFEQLYSVHLENGGQAFP